MEEVLEIYRRQYDSRFPVVCMDELSKQLTKEVRNSIKAKKGRIEKYDSEYERNGTANVFLYIEPLTGKFYTKVTKQRTKPDWAKTIKELVDKKYPKAERIILVLDNLNTHLGNSLYETYPPEEARRLLDKLDFKYTPKHGSWLNIAECGLSILSKQCLDRRIPEMKILKKEIRAWTKDRNEKEFKIDWRFTTKDARIKLKKLYPTL